MVPPKMLTAHDDDAGGDVPSREVDLEETQDEDDEELDLCLGFEWEALAAK